GGAPLAPPSSMTIEVVVDQAGDVGAGDEGVVVDPPSRVAYLARADGDDVARPRRLDHARVDPDMAADAVGPGPLLLVPARLVPDLDLVSFRQPARDHRAELLGAQESQHLVAGGAAHHPAFRDQLHEPDELSRRAHAEAELPL